MDGTSNNPVKADAKDLFFKFWNIQETDPPYRPDGGIYGSYYFNDDAQSAGDHAGLESGITLLTKHQVQVLH